MEVVEGEVESKREAATILHTIKYPTPHQHVVGEHRDDLGAAPHDFVGFVFDVGLHEGGVVEAGAKLGRVENGVLARGAEIDFMHE